MAKSPARRAKERSECETERARRTMVQDGTNPGQCGDRVATLHQDLRQSAEKKPKEIRLSISIILPARTEFLRTTVGLSPALGAFVAGLMISESAYAQEALAHLFPLRDSFVALFFVTMGLLVDPKALVSNLPLLAA